MWNSIEGFVKQSDVLEAINEVRRERGDPETSPSTLRQFILRLQPPVPRYRRPPYRGFYVTSADAERIRDALVANFTAVS